MCSECRDQEPGRGSVEGGCGGGAAEHSEGGVGDERQRERLKTDVK